jgi:cobalamin biosynthesis Mg chelatase CobN
MEKPVFKTFASAEGFIEILKSSFLALILALRANAIEPSQKAIELTDRLKNNREVSCCELKSEYRRMALELHPDKGGTDQDMAHLNNARDARDDCSQQKMRGCSRTSSSSSTKSSKGKSSKGKSSKGKSSKGKSSKGTKGSKGKSSTKSSKGSKGSKGKSSTKSSKGKSSKSKSSKSKSKKTQEKSFDSGRLFAGGVVAGGVVGLVVNAMDGRKSPKPHVRTPTSPRHR